MISYLFLKAITHGPVHLEPMICSPWSQGDSRGISFTAQDWFHQRLRDLP